MKTYELQTFHNGIWQFDSYFDSRDLVLSEAERMNVSGRYAGVRVLEETFDETKKASRYQTIFSRTRRGEADDWRQSTGRTPASPYGREGNRSAARRQAPQRNTASRTHLAWLLLAGSGVVVLGIGLILVLRQFAGSL